jgi:hypothetical protein
MANKARSFPLVADQPEASPLSMSPAERRVTGKKLRDAVPRTAHATWRAHAGRTDPLSILRAADNTRRPELVPLRCGRMLQSPFTSLPWLCRRHGS